MAVIEPVNARLEWQTPVADPADPSIHPVPDNVTIEPIAQLAKLLPVHIKEFVRRLECSQVPRNANFPDIRAGPRPFDRRAAQALGSRTIAAEAVRAAEPPLQRCEVRRVENETLKADPRVAGFHLDPGIEDFRGRDRIDKLGDDTALERLVNGEAMQSARDVGPP